MDLKIKEHAVLSGKFAIDNVAFSEKLENVQTVELYPCIRFFELKIGNNKVRNYEYL